MIKRCGWTVLCLTTRPRPARYGWTCQELPPTGIAQRVIGVHKPPYHDKPHGHNCPIGRNNYCKNGGSGGCPADKPWCYTTDLSSRWEYCNIPLCEDINECGSNPCRNGGTCTDALNKYSCTCHNGYEGTNCDTNTDECGSNPCQHGGTCSDRVNYYACTCNTGSEGSNCETDINECGSNPCRNGGICTDALNKYSCTCDNGYEGTNCDIMQGVVQGVVQGEKKEWRVGGECKELCKEKKGVVQGVVQGVVWEGESKSCVELKGRAV
ncbi:hypothetical protein LSAT2_030911 [Lamellibrachia satsuma]|nr:hypothetical protein LSAT2_030911 [Lamellibrachia satsuma]